MPETKPEIDPEANPKTDTSLNTPPPTSAPTLLTPTPTPTPSKAPSTSFIKKLIIFGGVGVILFFVGIFFFVSKATSEQSAKSLQFITDLQTNKADDAYILTATKFKSATSMDDFKKFVTKENAALPKSKPRIIAKQITTSDSTIIANIPGDNTGLDCNATIKLIKENGKWLILNAQIKEGLASLNP